MTTITTDVFIIGAGAAGIRAALAASAAGVDVVMVTKAPPTEGGATFSPMSKGWGIQALVGGLQRSWPREAYPLWLFGGGLLSAESAETFGVLENSEGMRARGWK